MFAVAGHKCGSHTVIIVLGESANDVTFYLMALLPSLDVATVIIRQSYFLQEFRGFLKLNLVDKL